MGVERSVTRWYIHHQRITDEIAALNAKLAQIQAEERSNASTQEIEKRLLTFQNKLRILGPCPKPMMG